MEQQQIVADIEARAKRAGVNISELCREADVHPTTFSRWKVSENNPAPIGASLKSLSALTEALDRIEARKAAA